MDRNGTAYQQCSSTVLAAVDGVGWLGVGAVSRRLYFAILLFGMENANRQ